MKLDLQRVSENVCRASTEDLLDRITVYREGMEPEALDLIEAELRRRGIESVAIDTHAANRQSTMIVASDGFPMKCESCWRPAVVEVWGWHRLWKLVPIFPRRMAYCEEHRPIPSEMTR